MNPALPGLVLSLGLLATVYVSGFSESAVTGPDGISPQSEAPLSVQSRASITLHTDHGHPHFVYTKADGSVTESPIDSALDDRNGLINELILFTDLSEEEVVEITEFPAGVE